MNILRHVLLLSSAGMVGGWLMVRRGLTQDTLLAGGVIIAALLCLYFVLLFIYWLLRPLTLRLGGTDIEYIGSGNEDRFPVRAFDARGRLRIHRERFTVR